MSAAIDSWGTLAEPGDLRSTKCRIVQIMVAEGPDMLDRAAALLREAEQTYGAHQYITSLEGHQWLHVHGGGYAIRVGLPS